MQAAMQHQARTHNNRRKLQIPYGQRDANQSPDVLRTTRMFRMLSYPEYFYKFQDSNLRLYRNSYRMQLRNRRNYQTISRMMHAQSDNEWQKEDIRRVDCRALRKHEKVALSSTNFKHIRHFQDQGDSSIDQSYASRPSSLGVILKGLRCERDDHLGVPYRANKAAGEIGKRIHRPSLKSLSCISSSDVLPSFSNCRIDGSANKGLNEFVGEARPRRMKLRIIKSPSHKVAAIKTRSLCFDLAMLGTVDLKSQSDRTSPVMIGSRKVSSSALVSLGTRTSPDGIGNGSCPKPNFSDFQYEATEEESKSSNRDRTDGTSAMTTLQSTSGPGVSALMFSQVHSTLFLPTTSSLATVSEGSRTALSRRPNIIDLESTALSVPKHRRNLEPILSSFRSPDEWLFSPETDCRPLQSSGCRGNIEENQLWPNVERLSELFMEDNLFLSSLGLHDQHREMRLDVDNMSYEELLELGESIGNVSTGLGKDAIMKCLKSECFSAEMDNATGKGVKCSICQEEFEDGMVLGEIDKCGHKFHFSCIEQWLLLKNLCPICKGSVQ